MVKPFVNICLRINLMQSKTCHTSITKAQKARSARILATNYLYAVMPAKAGIQTESRQAT